MKWFFALFKKKSKQRLSGLRRGNNRERDEFREVIHKNKRAILKFLEDGEQRELSEELFEYFFNYYSNTGEMPYGIQKARTGDPDVWIANKLELDMKARCL